jgi:hypothetical protein
MLSSHNKATSTSLTINVLPGEVANLPTPGHTWSPVDAPSPPLAGDPGHQIVQDSIPNILPSIAMRGIFATAQPEVPTPLTQSA